MRVPDDSSFDDRLSHWIASQGFWFQLRHSPGKTVLAKLLGRTLQVGLRLLVLAVLAVGLLVVYLAKRVDLSSFRERMPELAAAALQAETAKVRGFQRTAGRAYIHRLEAEGGRDSFFTTLEARGIRYQMGLLDGLVGTWDAGPVTVTAARIEVKAGAEDDAEAVAAGEALFGEHDWFEFPLVEVLDATVLWGYSERTRGMIQGSHLIAQRLDTGWLLQFRGGQLSQNWLRKLEIDELLIRLTPGGVRIEKGELRRGDGRLSLGGEVKGGVYPAINAGVKFEQLPVLAILPAEARPFIEGSISGEAKISGSTNSQEGLQFDCDVLLGGEDRLLLRDRLPLLRALTVVDVYNSYRRIDFTTGGFKMKTGTGRMEIERLDLMAADVVRLSGRMLVRPPSDEEIARTLAEGPAIRDSAFFESIVDEMEPGGDGDNGPAEDGQEEFTLRRAAEAARGEANRPENTAPSVGLPNIGLMPMSLEQQARDRYAKLVRYEGGFVLEIPSDAFERARALRESHPADPASGRIPLEVPLTGTLFELTLDQAEEIYGKGRRTE